MKTAGDSETSDNIQQIPEKAAFIIGITGNTDPSGYTESCEDEGDPRITLLRKRIRGILEWMTMPSGWLNPSTGRFDPVGEPPVDTHEGYFSCWRALFSQRLGRRPHTPIIVLSSLARGVDIIVAEEALDFARSTGAAISVRAPLSFPLKEYRKSSSVVGTGTPESDANALARFDTVVTRIREQPGFIEERDLFCVALDRDLETKDGTMERDLADDRRRRIRYRAAGEYIATNSNLLLAVYDRPWDERGAPSAPADADIFAPVDISAPGTAALVRAKRAGLSYKLLAVSNNFTWADNGPVLVIPIDRKKNADVAATGAPCGRPLEFLHPFDSMPKSGMRDDAPEWQERGDVLFRRILEHVEDFNATPISNGENTACAKLLGDFAGLSPEAARFAQTQDALARVRRRAADKAGRAEGRRSTMLIHLAILITIAAISLGFFEHWHPQDAHARRSTHDAVENANSAAWFVHARGEIVQAALLLFTLVAVAASAYKYRRYRREKNERYRFDFRAVAEGLRVQFFWNIAGIPRSVPANYMQRQHGELTWIRSVINSLATPFERTSHAFAKLAPGTQQELLKVAVRSWVAGQRDYYAQRVKTTMHRQHRCHLFGWAFSIAAVVQVVLMFFAWGMPVVAECLMSPMCVFFIALVLAMAGVVLDRNNLAAIRGWLAKSAVKLGYDFIVEELHLDREFRCETWLRSDTREREQFPFGEPNGHGTDPTRTERGPREIWSLALLLSAPVLVLPHLLEIPVCLPDWRDWWIILTGALLFAGALILAWAERNFLAETSRLYHTMLGLYTAAGRRLEPLVDAFGTTAPGPERDRIRDEIQAILYALGCEALDENAEWLILRRARPLEPFTAG